MVLTVARARFRKPRARLLSDDRDAITKSRLLRGSYVVGIFPCKWSFFKVAIDDAHACHMSVLRMRGGTILYDVQRRLSSSTIYSFGQSNIDGVQDVAMGGYFGLPKTGNPGHTV
jgi:hypothetical protein